MSENDFIKNIQIVTSPLVNHFVLYKSNNGFVLKNNKMYYVLAFINIKVNLEFI
jgi:hypothetical protein